MSKRIVCLNYDYNLHQKIKDYFWFEHMYRSIKSSISNKYIKEMLNDAKSHSHEYCPNDYYLKEESNVLKIIYSIIERRDIDRFIKIYSFIFFEYNYYQDIHYLKDTSVFYDIVFSKTCIIDSYKDYLVKQTKKYDLLLNKYKFEFESESESELFSRYKI